jgi:hypothetical protein
LVPPDAPFDAPDAPALFPPDALDVPAFALELPPLLSESVLEPPPHAASTSEMATPTQAFE